jgi:hypothetical protein
MKSLYFKNTDSFFGDILCGGGSGQATEIRKFLANKYLLHLAHSTQSRL